MSARVVVFAPAPVGERMSGPAIRAVEFARVLARRFDATLAAPPGSRPEGVAPGLCCVEFTRSSAASILRGRDVAVSRGTEYPALASLPGRGRRTAQVFDLYDPFLFSWAHTVADAGRSRPARAHVSRLTRLLLKRADLVLCASEAQRDLWCGGMYVSGGVEPPDRDRVAIVPFGHPGAFPQPREPVLRGVRPGIEADSKLVIWGGGIWRWLDADTAVDAVAAANAEDPSVKLLFLGGTPPGGDDGWADDSARVRARCARRGLLDRVVFFQDDWAPYPARHAYLAEADLALCASAGGAEQHFASRSRLADALWAGLPIVCTRGDGMAAFVERQRLGLTVAAGRPRELAAAILSALEPERADAFRGAVARHRDALSWDRCLQPLLAFCEWVGEHGPPRRDESRWTPWLQYAEYKLPAMLARLGGRS